MASDRSIFNRRYFRSTRKSPTERHLYSISLSGKNLAELTDTNKDGYYHVSFSPLAQYYLLTYAGPDIPYQYVLSTTDPSFRVLEEDNSQLGDYLKKYDLPYRVYGTVKMNGYSFNYNEIRPPNFDDSGKTKYPVLFHIYGGPVSQIVDKAFIIDWHFWIASEPRLEYLVVQIDCRGTGFMGRKLRTGIRGQLGYLESSDLATAAEYSSQVTRLTKAMEIESVRKSREIRVMGMVIRGVFDIKNPGISPGCIPVCHGRCARYELAFLRLNIYRAIHVDATGESARVSYYGHC